jgi:hypothetical protein
LIPDTGGAMVRTAVVMINSTEVGPFSVTGLEDTAQVVPCGRPVQPIVTGSVNPGSGVIINVYGAVWPAETGGLDDSAEIWKLGTLPDPVNCTIWGPGALSVMANAPMLEPMDEGV